MIQFCKHSEKGGDHKENEDFVSYRKHPSFSNRYIAVIADGQGGRVDGDLASKHCCESTIEFLAATSWEKLASEEEVWDQLIKATDQTVRQNCEGFTTMIAFAICPDFLAGSSVGDSKLYFNTNSVTTELTSKQRKNPAIGAGCNSGTLFQIPEPKGKLIAATDGVWKYCGYDKIEQALFEPIENTVDIIRPHCQLKSGKLPDDFSFISASI